MNMLFAGSVLAMLLAGLTVDALVNPLEEEDDTNAESPDPNEDGGGAMTSVGNLLDQIDAEGLEDGSLNARADALGYTPLDELEDTPEVGAATATAAMAGLAALAAAPAMLPEDAEPDLMGADEDDGANHLHEVTQTTALTDGSEVPLVTDFATETDVLVMEFDGSEKDAPKITLEERDTGGGTLVKANGHAITLVQNAPDLTEKHVSIVMSETSADQVVLPGPVVDVVENISDGLPEEAEINGIFDMLSTELSATGAASDLLDARAVIDPAFGTGGTDAVTGTFEDNDLTGDDGQNALFGDEGNDTLSGGGGNDELYGDFGNDDLRGGAGVDFLSGGEGDDALDGGEGRDLLFGGDGNDTILVGDGDIAQGGVGADTFIGADHTDGDAGFVSDFNPTEDRIEVIYDPFANPEPMIEVQDFSDGSGADIILDGEVILSVAGAQGLDPNMIELRANP
jgi:hypothetical protein